VPVIASRHVHAGSDLIRPGANGTIVRHDDPDRWADAITEVTDPARRDDLSATARAVGHAFAPHRAASWLLDLLESAERARLDDGRRQPSRSFVEHAWRHLVPTEAARPTTGERPSPDEGDQLAGGHARGPRPGMRRMTRPQARQDH
jgi:hypothetical protein